jgi:GGDEF domain-containing protein
VTRELSSRGRRQQGICEAVLEVSSAATVLLLEPDGAGELTATAVSGGELPGARISLGEEPNGSARAFVLQEPVFVADVHADPTMSWPLLEEAGARTVLYEPVLHHGQAIGLLVLMWTERLEQVPSRGVGHRAAARARGGGRDRTRRPAHQAPGLARVDALTGIPNRRVWNEELPRELARARRSQLPLCVAILDLDHFKRFNDRHGHQAGDQLKASAASWQGIVRGTDLLARYGGEEFALLLPSCSLESALALADRLRGASPAT